MQCKIFDNMRKGKCMRDSLGILAGALCIPNGIRLNCKVTKKSDKI